MRALIERWQAGDERAAETLYNHYRQPIFWLAYLMLGDSGDAEEVAQDALTYALINIDRYDAERASFKSWLHTIAISRCRDKRRRKYLPRLSLTVWLQRGEDIPDNAVLPEQTAVQHETNSQIWQAVQRLKPSLREAILLRHWAGHSYKEMALILGCPTRTAQSRVRLAHERLRQELAADGFLGLEHELST